MLKENKKNIIDNKYIRILLTINKNMEEKEQLLTSNDLVAYYGDDGGYHSAGYLISSVFDNNKLPPIVTINNQAVKGAASLQTGGKKNKDRKEDSFARDFAGLAIPLGLASLSLASVAETELGGSSNLQEAEFMDGGRKKIKSTHMDVVTESLYDRLLDLVSEHKKEGKQRKTKRKSLEKKNKRKTRKHK